MCFGAFARGQTVLATGFGAFPRGPLSIYLALLPSGPRATPIFAADCCGDGLAAVASLAGLRNPPQDAQYVTTGGTQRCPLLFPCIAFRHEGKVMLLVPQGKEVAAFDLGPELLDRSAGVQTPEEAAARYDRLVDEAKSKGEELFMFGGNLLGPARPRWRGPIPARRHR